MKMSDLKPASTLAGKLGVKMVAYGPPGAGKTPIFNTAPRPVLCVTEPGMLSMRNSSVPCWEAYTPEKVTEFMDWLFRSGEAKNFDTVGFDSISQVAEIFLTRALAKNKDGRAAYGQMSREIMEIVNALFYMQSKHIYLIAKMSIEDLGSAKYRRPFFPGQDLNVKIPHMFDQISYIGKAMIPGVIGEQTAIRTAATVDILARDRSGMLAELEPPNLTAVFNKAMSF